MVIVRYKLGGGGNRDVGALDRLDMTGDKKPVAAYALRQLFGDYIRPQVRISRSSDSKTADVYFDRHGKVTLVQAEDGETSKSLDGWLDGADAKVREWFDQSGNGHHALQDNTDRQPKLETDHPDNMRFSQINWLNSGFGQGMSATKPHTVHMFLQQNHENMVASTHILETHGNRRAYFGINSGEWSMGIESNGWSSSGINADLGVWTNLTVVFEGSQAMLYVNGEFTISVSYDDYTFINNYIIGASSSSTRTADDADYLDGYFGTFQIYPTALSQDQIKKIINT